MIPMRITCYHVLEECFPNITKIIPNTLVGSERKKKKNYMENIFEKYAFP